ncbi:unnamed protein product [Gongylonema pulchrum]|uniref:Seryl_tRNA_N domain-containing protein n=1 Tax=Gongylonema pulchrum TaxID=637853 RepID=A0A183DH19_9BILA|nr:unnamed protein product [Gongylonema pulchrum]
MWKAAEKVRLFRSERNDELLSNQMLAGIPEVDLGINARMSNIIETEKKKSEMLKEVIEKRRNLAEDSLFSQDRAKNLAKNYVQHSICKYFCLGIFCYFSYIITVSAVDLRHA